ncbi:MAG: DUF1232 domain-containing protein, partial [Anaerolineae bacterium]|nr:DUF1232 domain-containing protein [Anaerolineae bacterium]
MESSPDTRNFVVDFWTLFFDARVSLASKAIFLVIVPAYVFFPIDLIPDMLLPVGIADDGGVLVLAMWVFVRHASRQLENRSFMADEEQMKLDSGMPRDALVSGNRTGDIPAVWGCFATTGFLALLVFLGITISILSGVMTFNNLVSSFGNFLGQPTTATVVSSRTIVSSLQPLGQLVSISAEVAKADIGVSVHTGGINLCGHSANHVAQGAIEAGVDIT